MYHTLKCTVPQPSPATPRTGTSFFAASSAHKTSNVSKDVEMFIELKKLEAEIRMNGLLVRVSSA